MRGWLYVTVMVLYALTPCAGAAPPDSSRLGQHPSSSWPTNGGNLFNQRYSPLSQIDINNVSQLKGVWHAHLNGSGVGPPYSGEAQPIVDNGVIYIITGADDVFAISVETGEILWTYESGLDPNISTICCGWTSRGVAIGDGKVFVGRLDGRLVALDRTTGVEVWDVQAERWQDGFTITSAPLFFDGMVITGFGGAEYGVRGRVKAFDARDGSLRWTFYTIPGPNEPGHQTWPADSDAWKHGGATVWNTPAVDAELGLLYFSTANPGPAFNGGVRAGDNLYSVSMLAIDAHSGKYRWHFQQVHHDLWDYDASNPVVLFDLEVAGEQRKAIAEAGKTGWVYILDRVTGKPLLGISEQPVAQEPRQLTSATQPVPAGEAFVPQAMDMPLYGYPFINRGKIFTPYWDKPVAIRPSSFGGTTWAPASYDPRSKLLYVCGIDLVGLFVGGGTDGWKPESQYLGGEFMFDNARTGIFAAVDMRTNTVAWQQRWPDSCYSGSTATAGNLLFTGHNDGRFVAMNSSNGEVLWEFQTGAGVNAPAAVFEHRGQQYVAVYAAGALFAQSKPGDSVWLFSLNGSLEQLESHTGPLITTGSVAVGDSAEGDQAVTSATEPLYVRYCSQCHGVERDGGHGGGPSLSEPLNRAHVLEMITKGNDRMPGFSSALTYAEVQQLVDYISAGVQTAE